MARYALNLPAQLKQDAEKWAVAEKVGALSQQLDDPEFPQIDYRRGSSGVPQAMIRGTGVRVQTVVTAALAFGRGRLDPGTGTGVTSSRSWRDAHAHAMDAPPCQRGNPIAGRDSAGARDFLYSTSAISWRLPVVIPNTPVSSLPTSVAGHCPPSNHTLPKTALRFFVSILFLCSRHLSLCRPFAGVSRIAHEGRRNCHE